MSQHDFEIANQGFPAFRSDLNDGLQALASNSAGTSEPTTTYAYQFWYDTTNDLLKMRNTDDDAWIELAYFDQTNDEWEVRSAVIQAVDSAGVSIKTDDGTTRIEVQDDGDVSIDSGTLFVDASSNNVGIGTTSTPSTTVPHLKVDSNSFLADNGLTSLSHNAYFNSGWRYNATAAAALYQMDGDEHVWYSKASGTAGNAVAFSERMRLDSSGNLLFDSGFGSVATAYGCRAWVNFNGTGTVSIREDGNVSSITDIGTGTYQINFTNAMPDANYVQVAGAQGVSGSSGAVAFNANSRGNNATTSSELLTSSAFSDAGLDLANIYVAIFR